MTHKNREDVRQIEVALIEWFRSQEIGSQMAGYVCARMAGHVAATLAFGDSEDTAKGVEILNRITRNAAEMACTLSRIGKDIQ